MRREAVVVVVVAVVVAVERRAVWLWAGGCACARCHVRDGGIFAELGHEQVSKVVKNFAWGSILTPVHHGRISSRPRASPT